MAEELLSPSGVRSRTAHFGQGLTERYQDRGVYSEHGVYQGEKAVSLNTFKRKNNRQRNLTDEPMGKSQSARQIGGEVMGL